MEPESSLLRSQEPATQPYCEPGESSSHPIFLRLILILSSHLCLGPLRALFPSGFSNTILYVFFTSPVYNMSHQSPPPWLDHPKKKYYEQK